MTDSKVIVHCGPFSFSLSLLYSLYDKIDDCIGYFEKKGLRTSLFMKFICQSSAQICDLKSQNIGLDRQDYSRITNVLRGQIIKQTAEPREKIYGITGLFRPWRDGLLIDYRLSVGDVYVTAFKFTVQMYNSLNILVDQIRIPKVERLTELPSWCPDWSQNLNPIYTADGINARGDTSIWDVPAFFQRKFRACKNALPKITFTNNDKVLTVSGLVLDVIENLAGCFSSTSSLLDKTQAKTLSNVMDLAQLFSGGPYWSY